jgi:outer membrane lipoprotein SlyB
MISIARLGSAALAATMIVGCASRPTSTPAPQYGGYSQGGYYGGQQGQYQLGVVQSIEPIRAESRTSGGGALVGGAVGGLLGHQIDSGSRRDAATLAGVVAGALIGNQIEKNNSGARDVVRVTVRLDSGETRSFDYAQLGDVRVGDRVRVDPDNQVYRY